MTNIAVAHQLLSAFLLLGLLSLFYEAIEKRRIAVWAQALPWCRNDVQRCPILFLSAFPADKARDPSGSGSLHPSLNASPEKKSRSSMAADWLAPVIVWFLVISMGLAVASLLLGER